MATNWTWRLRSSMSVIPAFAASVAVMVRMAYSMRTASIIAPPPRLLWLVSSSVWLAAPVECTAIKQVASVPRRVVLAILLSVRWSFWSSSSPSVTDSARSMPAPRHAAHAGNGRLFIESAASSPVRRVRRRARSSHP